METSAEFSLDEKIQAEAVNFLYESLPSILFSLILMPTALLLVMWSSANHSHLVMWFCTTVVLLVIRIALAKTYMKAKPGIDRAPRWGGYFALTSLSWGVMWGLAAMLFFVPDSVGHQVFIYTCIIGLATGQIIVTSYWLTSYYAFAFPAIILCATRLFMEGTLEYQGLALLLIMFLGIVTKVAHNTNKFALESIRLRFENTDLVEDLREQKDRAEQANTAKTRFLASASHDLRQPVHALSLLANSLQSEVSTDRSRSLLGSMSMSIDALGQLLGALLDISKLDAGVVSTNINSFSLNELLANLDKELAPQANARQVELKVRSCDAIVESDFALLTTIIRNLVSNAVKYTNEGGVLVGCRKRDNEVIVEVWDTGIGIPEAEQENVFSEFMQLNNPERDRSKGLGLGLAICKRLASLLDHQITVESTVNQGSVFRVHLPLSAAEPQLTAQTERAMQLSWDMQGKSVLVIDDEESVRVAMDSVLADWGCITYTAESGVAGIAVIENREVVPDIIIADYRLRNNETGVAAVHAVQARLDVEIPAIIITGDTAPERIKEASDSGFLLIHKPVKPAELRMKISSLLRSHSRDVMT